MTIHSTLTATRTFVSDSFACIAHFESTDTNAPPSYGQSGFYQIADVSLHSIAHLSGTASQYPERTQLAAAELIQRAQGWHQAFPISSRKCGL